MKRYIAIDLGAESGRVMLGALADGRLFLEELHRFPNTPIRVDGSLCWDIDALWNGIKIGLKKAAALNVPIASISTDSWGIDYVLFDRKGAVLPPVYHYRDSRTSRGVERVRSLTPWAEVFAETGIQFMPMNTIYQLAAEPPERLQEAHQLLPIADAVNFLLSGVARAEESLASTSQVYNPRTRDWSAPLLQRMQFPSGIFPLIVRSGSVLGPLRNELAQETGLAGVQVIASCSHDTGAAVAGVPAEGDDWAYISSGTWSLMGVEIKAPLLTDACREFNFTNEIGFGGSVRLLKNIVGLWVVQECRRHWAAGGNDFDYGTLMRLASEVPPFVSLLDLTDPRFLTAGDMPGKIDAFCLETKQPLPDTPGATIRCVLEGLALLYRRTLEEVEQLIGRKTGVLHIVGGGSRNELLNQFTANALGIPVLAGPVEATALGNVCVQALALGDLPSLPEARAIIRQSFALRRYEPTDRGPWEAARQRATELQRP